MSNSKPKYKLTYFDGRGLAEPIRLIFAHAGVEYEDIRIPFSKLTDERRDELRLQYGTLPLLEIDGEVYSQAFPIMSYLAKKFDLTSTEEFENIRIEECIDQLRDYFNKWMPMFYESTPLEVKEKLRERITAVDTPVVMAKFNDILVKNNESGSPWFIGERMTWLDICIAHYTINFETSIYKEDLIKDFPAIKTLRQLVFDQPRIKEWIAKRPDTPF